jgi:signal transduction histidine kinase
MKLFNWLKVISQFIPPKSEKPLLKYVVFSLNDTNNSITSSTRNKLLFFAFSGLIALALVSASKPLIEKFHLPENTFWIDSPTHSLIENFGGLIAIIIGLIISWEYLKSGKKNVLFLALAFSSMGILDIFHAFSDYCHNMFVWFHSSSAFLGSVFFIGSIFFINEEIDSNNQKVWIWRINLLLGILMIFTFAIISIKFFSHLPDVLKMKLPHHTPVTEVKGHFSNFVYSLNFISCILFLFSGIILVNGFLKTNDIIYLIFGASALLLFESEISFTFSKLWDPMWWYWHFIKVIIFSGLLIGLAYGFTRTFYGLHKSEMELSKLLEEIEKKNIELLKAYETLKETQRYLRESEKLASIGKLAASMAHEIRNPLGAITNSLGALMRYKSLSLDDLELFEIVDKEIDRLNKMVEDFLDYSRKSRLDKKETDIHALINETLSVFKMDGKVVSDFIIKTSYDSDIPLLRLDRNKIKQVFLNLYNNAIQAMPQSKGVLNISTRYKKTEDEVEVTITDNGTGMSDDVLLRVFEPFFSTKDKGMGLGLNIAHKKHDGHILVSSKVGNGTQIQLNFPVISKDVTLAKDKSITTLTEPN